MRRAITGLAKLSLPLLRRLDPELAHQWGLRALHLAAPWWPPLEAPGPLRVNCLGLKFDHPVGLAAGFDKNGDHIDALGALGFSHIEFGTVTPRPQPGNPKPRMFRFPADQALINRMGFNNLGVDHLVKRLQRQTGHAYRGVRGVSIGKNFDTPLESAEEDYLFCLRRVYAHADYVAVNVSSPNTARLRELQARAGLQRLLGGLLEEREALAQRTHRRVPLLVKIAPDLNDEQIGALAEDVRALSIDGVIATNTTVNHALLAAPPEPPLQGGLSGAPLHGRSVAVIRLLRQAIGANTPIIGVGGIVDATHARATLAAGATLLQVYTGFAYQGAALLDEIVRGLAG
jgi:dihydroorotate dehydrogenase